MLPRRLYRIMLEHTVPLSYQPLLYLFLSSYYATPHHATLSLIEFQTLMRHFCDFFQSSCLHPLILSRIVRQLIKLCPRNPLRVYILVSYFLVDINLLVDQPPRFLFISQTDECNFSVLAYCLNVTMKKSPDEGMQVQIE